MYREVKALFPLSIYKLLSGPLKRLLYLMYRGQQLRCILCGASYRAFIPYRGRSNAGCVCCESLERHRILWYYLQHKTDLLKRESLRVLHIAPENCLYDKFMQVPAVEYYAGDIHPAMYKDIDAVMKIDVEQLSFADNFFDLIICSHVLEHVAQDRKAIAEMYRVLKKGGLAVILIPVEESLEKTYEDASITRPAARKKAFKQRDHVRLYGQDFVDRLKEPSFKVRKEDVVATMPRTDRARYGFERHEILYCCTK